MSRRGDSRRLPPGISIRAHQVEAALDDVARRVPGAKPDGWLPSVQGAVGHVVGIKLSSIDDRLGDRGAAILKVYGAHGAARAPIEASVLRQLDGWTVLPTPRLLATGSVDGLPWVLMTRLEGVRWVDYMRQHGAAAQMALIQATARMLRVLHARPGPAFGGILPGDERQPTALDAVRARAISALLEYEATVESSSVSGGARRWLDRQWLAFAVSVGPVLLHNDVNRGNLLVDSAGLLSGLVDWERAAFGDPIADLAHLAQHLRHESDDDVEVLLAAYGVDDSGRARLEVYEVLEALTERAWIALDRPHGWSDSVDRLDAWVTARLHDR